MGTLNDIMNLGLWSEVTEPGIDYAEPYFTHQGCDVCAERTGRRLGNTVVDIEGYRTLEDARKGPDHAFDFRTCGGCLNAYANGEAFPEDT